MNGRGFTFIVFIIFHLVDYFRKEPMYLLYCLPKFNHRKIERGREGEICDNDLAQVLETKPNEAQLIEKVERRGKRREIRRIPFLDKRVTAGRPREVPPQWNPLTSKTVIHAGRASLLPGCKMPIVFLAIRNTLRLEKCLSVTRYFLRSLSPRRSLTNVLK